MITPKRNERPSRPGVLSAVVVSCLLASLPLAAQDRSHSRPSEGGSSGRTAHEIGGSSGPSHTSPPAPSSGGSSAWRSDSGSSGSSGSGGSKPPRTAVPVAPGGPDAGGPHRQPPHGRSQHGGRGHVYYPGYGYYPYGSFWWNVLWGYPYGYDYGYPRDYGYGYGHDRDDSFGALDLDVSPAQTQVFLDGQYIGTVDDFDGWPRYLWLEKGTYDLVLYYPGFKTDARQITIYPGLVIDIDDRMEKGDSIRPEDLVTKDHVRRDARQRYDSERERELDRRRDDSADERDDESDHQDEWRSRRRERVIERHDSSGNASGEMSEDADGRDSALSEDSGSGAIKIEIEPDDASVYLDGKFVGTGADLAKMANGLPVEPGDHKLSVVRPGRKDENVNVRIKAGRTVQVEVQMEDKEND